jgi:endonuclease/exonuclease/phosphatase family metal-dependent hydrolase
MSISFGPVTHFVRQALHLEQTEKPEAKVPTGRASTVDKLLHPLVVKNNPQAPPPPAAPSKLAVLSFNVRLGGLDYPGVAKTVADAKADVVCLQEVSREHAEKIAASLGMHLTFYQSVRHNNDLANGKAILSKFPTVQAQSKPYDVSVVDRLKGMWEKFRRSEGSLKDRIFGTVSLWQKRNVLTTTMKIGGKTVDVIDTHLTTGAPATAAKQYAQLQEYVKARRAMGHEVILAGDFNTRLDKPAATGPDTRGYAALKGLVTDAYDAAAIRVKGLDGRVRTPAEAREALKAPGLSAKERDTLQRQALGTTSSAGNGRIDAVLTTDGFRARGVYIDQANDASDHEPVLATFDVAR